MAKKIRGEDGKVYKQHKPFYKKVWFWILVVIIIIAFNLGNTDDKANETTTNKSEKTSNSSTPVENKGTEKKVSEPASEEKTEDVPTEYKSALRSAENYSDMMNMSKQGVFDQLTSEYGDKFSAEAAQYAIDNISADWNANALKSAENYQETMAMSPEAIRDQLTSEHGEKFTQEEADYALNNLSN